MRPTPIPEKRPKRPLVTLHFGKGWGRFFGEAEKLKKRDEIERDHRCVVLRLFVLLYTSVR